MPAFMPDGRARAAPHAFSCPARSLRVFRVFRAGLLWGECCSGLSRLASPPPREDKGRRSVVRGESRQKSGFSLLIAPKRNEDRAET